MTRGLSLRMVFSLLFQDTLLFLDLLANHRIHAEALEATIHYF